MRLLTKRHSLLAGFLALALVSVSASASSVLYSFTHLAESVHLHAHEGESHRHNHDADSHHDFSDEELPFAIHARKPEGNVRSEIRSNFYQGRVDLTVSGHRLIATSNSGARPPSSLHAFIFTTHLFSRPPTAFLS